MNELSLQIYVQLVGFAGLVGAAYLFTSGQTIRAIAAAGIAMIALSDAHTWSLPGISQAARCLSFLVLDFIGVIAALMALTSTGMLAPNDPTACSLRKAIWAAVAYIFCCLAYWLLLGIQQGPSDAVKQAMSISQGKIVLFVVLFVVSLLVLFWVAKRERAHPGNWLPFTVAVWLYLVGYTGLVTLQLLRGGDTRQRQFVASLAQIPFPKDWKISENEPRFTGDYQKALVVFSNAVSRTAVEVIFENDGFDRYVASFQLGSNSFTNLAVKVPRN